MTTVQIRERICIAGFCQTSRDMTPYDDDRYTIVGLNRGAIFMPRADVWFDLHSPLIRGWEHRRPGHHLEWLKQFPGPVFLHEADPEIPNSVRYPLEEIQADVGRHLFRQNEKSSERTDCLQRPYMDSSIAYELAWAIHMQPKEILLVGVDLNTQSEYVFQRSGVSYLLGLAQGRGIDVVLPDECPLLTGPLYGRGYLAEKGEHMSAEQLEARLNALIQERNGTMAELHTTKGAHREVQFILSQMIPGINHEKVDERRVKIEKALMEQTGKLQMCEGALKETLFWIHQTPDGMSQSEAAEQIKRLDVDLNGYHKNGGEELSEGDLSEYAQLDEPELAAVN